MEISTTKHKKKTAIVLQNLGGPRTLDAVEPFLFNLFMDEDIIKLPFKGSVRYFLARLISSLRSIPVRKKYAEIGGGSPLNCWSIIQAFQLQNWLNVRDETTEYTVKLAMRYWHPMTDQILKEMSGTEWDSVIVMPLYPHFSYTTTGSGFREWQRCKPKYPESLAWKEQLIPSWHLNPYYIQIIQKRIDEGLLRFSDEIRDQVHIVFSAHGTPVSEVQAGDPYSVQIKETVEAVMVNRPIKNTWWQMYQSKVGPARWLEPNADTFIPLLKSYGVHYILVVPISFVSDHIETDHEIGIEFAELAHECGILQFEYTRGINDDPLFIEGLGMEVLMRKI
jgi:protoporphyrin/coproporphyrin ferrochelatase